MRGWLTRWLGNSGEDAAVAFLRGRGFQVIARNCRTRWGEIDIIAKDGDWIVFVEVKTRSTKAAGLPAEAVTRRKQAQLTRLALAWLKQKDLLTHRARFDVVAVLWPDRSRAPEIQHIPHAFEAAQ